MSSTEGKEEKPSDTRTLFYIDIWDQKYNPLETKETVTHYDPTPWDINYCTAITQLCGRYHSPREKNQRIQYYWDIIGSGTGERRNVKKQNTTLDRFLQYGSFRDLDIFSSMWHLKAASQCLLFALTLVILKSALRWRN